MSDTDFTSLSTPAFDPMDIDLADVDLEVYEDPETGATTYDKPEPADEVVENGDEFVPDDEPTDAVDLIADAPEDTVVAKLEDGTVLTKRDVVELAQKRSQVEDDHTYVSTLAANLKQSEKHLEFIKSRSLSEVDKQIAAVRDILRDPHLSDAERGQRHRQLQQFEARQQILNGEFQQAQDIIDGQKAEILGTRIKQTDEAMMAKHGKAWATGARDTYQFAIGLGMSPDEISQVISPAFADILVMARKWTNLENAKRTKVKQDVEAAVARSKSPRQTHTRSEPANSGRKTAYQQKVMSGAATKEDFVEAFDPDWF